MIPASYLYKDAYRQAWIDPDIEDAKARTDAHRDGHHIWNTLVALISRLATHCPTFHPVRSAHAAYDCA